MRCRASLAPAAPDPVPMTEVTEWLDWRTSLVTDARPWATQHDDLISWRVHPAARDILSDISTEHLTGSHDAPGIRLLKRSGGRYVFLISKRAEWPSALIAKQYRFGGAADAFKRAAGAEKSQREFRMSGQFQKSGLPVPPTLAYGLVNSPEWVGSIILQAAVPAAVSLRRRAELCRASASFQCSGLQRISLITLLARALSHMHDSGYGHDDLHAGNILVQPAPDGSSLIWLIDLDETFCSIPLPPRFARRSLALLRVSLGDAGLSRFDLLRFLKVYLGRDYRALAAEVSTEIAEAADDICQREYRARTRRSMRSSPYAALKNQFGRRILISRDIPEELVMRALENHKQLVSGQAESRPISRILKRSGENVVTLYRESEGLGLCVKQYDCSNPVDRAKRAALSSRARRSWKRFQGLFHRHIPAALPVAIIEPTSPSLAEPSYLVTREVANARAFDRYLAHRLMPEFPECWPPAQRRKAMIEISAKLAGLFLLMERNHVFHSDAKASNIFIQEVSDGIRMVLLDAESVRFGVNQERRHRIRNLAQLHAGIPSACSPVERLRFLKILLGPNTSWKERKKWALDIIAESANRDPVWLRANPPDYSKE